MNRKLHSDSPSAGALMGTNGAVIIADTSEKIGPFFGLLAITDVEIDEADLNSTIITGSIDGLTLLAGSYLPLYGINAITLTSGTAVAYLM